MSFRTSELKPEDLPESIHPTSGSKKIYGIELRPALPKNLPLRTIVGVCTLLWVVTLFWPEVEMLGALSWQGLRHNMWWQLVTHMFLHGGIIHLLFNMLALVFFARTVEGRIGRTGWLVIFFAAGLVGGMTQLLVHFGRDEALVGASGGIMGIWGAMIACALRLRLLPRSARSFARELNLRELLIWLAIQMVLDQSVAIIAAYAHLGGLVTGFAIAMLLPLKGSISVSASRAEVVKVLNWVSEKSGSKGKEKTVHFKQVAIGLELDFNPESDFLLVEQQCLTWSSRRATTVMLLEGKAPAGPDDPAWIQRAMVADPLFLVGVGGPEEADRAIAARRFKIRQPEETGEPTEPPPAEPPGSPADTPERKREEGPGERTDSPDGK